VYVCNYDTVLQAGMVRPRVGFVKHERVLDGNMSGRANLEEQAMLHFFTEEETERRIAELLPLTELSARIDAVTKTYAPDEWIRLEMVASLLHRPKVWIVDEPTRGCDANGREQVWRAFRQLRPQVVSVLLATADEAEAKALANRVVSVG
jgi:ABC-2 type transport system ATP-binding protein